ncbi:MAG: spore germination protein [Clostridia bacterium]
MDEKKDILKYIKDSTQNSDDIIYREIDVLNETVTIVYSEAMVSSIYISDFVIKSLKESVKDIVKIEKLEDIEKTIEDKQAMVKIISKTKNKPSEKSKRSVYDIISNLEKNISSCKVKKLDINTEDIFYYLFSGFSLIVYKDTILSLETRGIIDRPISETNTENSLKGSKDAFGENFQQNVALIRKRIKTEKLVLKQSLVGRRSKSKVGVMYISDIAKEGLVKEIEKRIKDIDIDAILNSNYIIENIEEGPKTDFPTVINTERPDLVSMYLLQGRVAIVIENSPFVLVAPSFIEDYINNVDDYYQKSSNVILTRIVRYIAFFITIVTPGLYVALITFNHEAIPAELLLSFSAQRAGVPFPASMEAFVMILAFEILREGDYRVTNIAGSTLSVVGALILGEAAVSAGIVSPIMIIVIAITAISGLLFNEINMTNASRNWRIIFLILGSIAGILGISVAVLFFIIKISSVTSFSKAYSYPVAPLNKTKILDDALNRKDMSILRNRYKNLTNNLTSRR